MYKIVEKFAFFPPTPSYDESFRNRSVRFIQKENSYGRIPYILYLAPVPKGEPLQTQFTIIFTHGNAEDIGQNDEWLSEVSVRLNVNVFSYDYTGYGLNGPVGQCSEADCMKDIQTVIKHVTEHLGVPHSKIVLWGRSLGSGPTTYIAAELSKKPATHFAGMILQSPIASCARVVTDKLTWVPWGDIFPNIDRICKVNAPIFIAHGTYDEVVPFNHGQQLAEKLTKDRKQLWKFLPIIGAGHNDIEARHADHLMNTMQEFLDFLANSSPTSHQTANSRT